VPWKNSETDEPVTEKSITAIACSVFRPELSALAERGLLPRFPIRYVDSLLHMRPAELQARLQEVLKEERRSSSGTLLIIGDCSAQMTDLETDPDVIRVAGANCGEMLLGKQLHKALIKDGAFFLFPEWAERWREILLGFPDMDAEMSKKMMRDMHKRFVYLNTGVVPVPSEALKACGDFFDLPCEVMDVGLDKFGKAIREALDRFPAPDPGKAKSSPDQAVTAVMMLDVVTTVLEHPGDVSDTAFRLSQKLRELTGSRLVILAVVEEFKEGASSPRILAVNPPRRADLLETELIQGIIRKSLETNQAVLLSEPTERQKAEMVSLGVDFCPCLILPLFIGEERVGSILSLGLLDADFTESISGIEKILSNVVAAVLKSALLQERQQKTSQALEREIAERKQAEALLAIKRQHLAAILEGTNVGTWEWNVQTGETVYNERWAEMIGYTLAELDPISIETWKKRAHPRDLAVSNSLLEKHFRKELPFYDCEIRLRHRNGVWVWIHDRGKVATWTEDGKPLMMYGTHQDITGRKMFEERIQHLATHDALTGLPGLRLANERLTWSLGLARRNKNMAAVMFIDLDGFKGVNDELGHDAGDFVLKAVAQRMLSCVRETDTIARVGGDEFLLIATSLNSARDAGEIARKIIQLVSRPIIFDGKQAAVGASIGIALYPTDSKDMDELIRMADKAMYGIKAAGKNAFGFAGTGCSSPEH
jgi:diguanylate cyclase (GGDEF)-like protein/PAS domain S-box-containing protein